MSHLNPSEWKEVIVAGVIWAILMVIVVGLVNYYHINVGQWGATGICCGNLAIAGVVGAALRAWAGKTILGGDSKAPPPSGQGQPPQQYQPPPRPVAQTALGRTCRHCKGPMDPASSYCPVCHRRN